jgi:type II secretory pathway component GspD/PulD (secretin)
MNIGYIAENVGKNILTVQLSALQTEGRLNILSSPSITTLDNQSAIFESGKEVPYQSVEEGSVKIEFKKAVLSLEVTPHVIDGKTIKMKIKTNKDEVDPTSAGDIPRIITKKAETNVILFDGQTMVIGGLSKESTADFKSSVPGLSDIPLLGWLFRGKKSEKTMEEVLIFITPYILGQRIAEEPITEEPITEEPITEELKPEPKPAKEKITEKVIPHVKKFFSVQIGAFLIKWDAHKMMASLRWRGYTPYIFQGIDYTRNRKLFAVRIGDYENMEKAYEALMLYKKKEGMPAVVTYIDSISAFPETETQ